MSKNPDRQIAAEEYTPEERGIPTAKWEKLGFTEPADATTVGQLFPGHVGPVAGGLIRAWLHANDAQRHSAEWQETFDSVNDDLFGAETPNVFPRAEFPVRG